MRTFRKTLAFLASLLFLSLPLIGWTQRQALADWWKIRNYTPSTRVVQLADTITLTDSGRRLFYVYQPILSDKSSFNNQCPDLEQTIILGCYNGEHIYVLDVQDERLKGIHEVTAAHELLHAAYDRLSSSERKRIDSLVDSAYRTVTSERIKQNVEQYRQRDASLLMNELHSIMGTEVRDLPGELEDYYRQYFSSRVAIVGFSEQYEKVFTDRQNAVAAYDTQLANLKVYIDSLEAQLTADIQKLNNERTRLEALLAAQQYDAYNQAVPQFNKMVQQYNGKLAQAKSLLDQYNKLVSERNAVALEEQELLKAIDSRALPESQAY